MNDKLLKNLTGRLKKIKETNAQLGLFMDALKLRSRDCTRHADIITEYELAEIEIEGAREYPDAWTDKRYGHILSHIELMERMLKL